MERLLNAFRAQSASQDLGLAQPRFATVTSVDPQTGNARVQLQPENVLSGWLPVLSHWVGNGWGLSCPPVPGDQVFVVPHEGDAENGVIIGRAWSQEQTVPNTPVGEVWLSHKSGSSIRLQNDGTVLIQGDVHVSGDVFDRHGSLDQLRSHFNTHRHFESKGGLTNLPNIQD